MGMLQKLRESKSGQGTLLVSPALLWMIVLLIVPLLLVVVTSFGRRDPDGNVIYTFTLDNYIRLLGFSTDCGALPAPCFDSLYAEILARSVGLALATTIFTILLGYPLAYFVARAPAKRRNLLLFLILVPLWTNFVIRVYAWIRILRAFDMLYTPQAVLIGMIYEFIPFMILPMYTSLEKIDPSLYEAAADLGANSLRTFLKVTLPLSLPGVVAGTLLVFVPVMGTFVVSDILGGKQFVLIGNLIQRQFLDARDPTFGSAASIILMAMTLIVMIIYTRKFGFGEEVVVG
jgi:spermidine/putrescine transport system permease protein